MIGWKMEKRSRIRGSLETSLTINYETITYSKQKARIRREKLSDLQQKIKESTAKCGEQPSQENLNDLEILQTEYDRQYDYIAKGAIIR